MIERRRFLAGLSSAFMALTVPLDGLAPRAAELKEIPSSQASIDPHLPPYNVRGDALQGSNASFEGNTMRVGSYAFTPADVGKTLWTDMWSGPRTIIALVAGDPTSCKFSGGAIATAAKRAFIFGNDDTAGCQAALDAAMVSGIGAQVGPAVAAVGNRAFGRTVKLRDGRLYLISNSAAAFRAGKPGALVLHRRTGIAAEGTAHAGFVLAPGSHGHALVNEGGDNPGANAAFADFITLKGFAIFGARGFGQPNALNLLHLAVSFQGYDYVDNFATVVDILTVDAPQDGASFSGRGEFMVRGLRTLFATRWGQSYDGLVDSSIVQFSSGGAGKAAIRVNRSANCRFTNGKGWYSGKNGKAVYDDCCNWLIDADQAKNGVDVFENCEGQEARGSGFVIKSGYHIFRGCRTQDAGQANGLDATATGPLPDIRAGLHLYGSGCIENDLDIAVQAGVRLFGPIPFLGSHALYVGPGAIDNRGRIETMKLLAYTGRSSPARADGARIGGVGTVNGTNTRLLVDGVALT